LQQNIILTGGLSNLPGFRLRIESELEGLKTCDAPIRTAQVDEASLAVCRGLKNLSCSQSFNEHVVTKQEFEEQGLRAFLKCIL
jgi:actin-related protein